VNPVTVNYRGDELDRDVRLVECSDCHCAVPWDSFQAHITWHSRIFVRVGGCTGSSEEGRAVSRPLHGGSERSRKRRERGRADPAPPPSRRSVAAPSLGRRPPGTAPAVRRHTCPSRLLFAAGPGVSAAGRALSLNSSRTRPPMRQPSSTTWIRPGGEPGRLIRSDAACLTFDSLAHDHRQVNVQCQT
jgi:hypothetical protein